MKDTGVEAKVSVSNGEGPIELPFEAGVKEMVGFESSGLVLGANGDLSSSVGFDGVKDKGAAGDLARGVGVKLKVGLGSSAGLAGDLANGVGVKVKVFGLVDGVVLCAGVVAPKENVADGSNEKVAGVFVDGAGAPKLKGAALGAANPPLALGALNGKADGASALGFDGTSSSS